MSPEIFSQKAGENDDVSMLSRDKRLPHDSWNTSDPEIILKEFTLAKHKKNKDQFLKLQGQGHYSQEMTNKIEAQFQCRRLQEGRRL